MHPYRPLFVVDETAERPTHELRGVAELLVALGALRVVPAILRGEGTSTELTTAIAMFITGFAILARVPHLWWRVRASWRDRRWRQPRASAELPGGDVPQMRD